MGPSADDPRSAGQMADTPVRPSVCWIDLALCAALLIGGFLYLADAPRWAANTYVGKAQYGDAQFWWDGALHFSQGIIAENPNLTYRMGYAAFAGSFAALFGPDYFAFHRVLILVFLAAAGALYLSAKSLIGRPAAAFGAALLAFNPYTAEWIAVSSSDGLGMILNMSALLALCAGVRAGPRLGWIAASGSLMALSSLTRPLMNPVMLPAAIAVGAAAAWRPKAVAKAWGALLGPFLALTLAWMTLMAATTGNFALTGASQDSSAFYAASDPQIQVWRGDMYGPVWKAAMERYHTRNPTASQLNREFWVLSVQNYRRYWRFHLDRFWPHIEQLAGFTSARAAYNDPTAALARTLVKAALAACLAGLALIRRRWAGAAAAAALGVLWIYWAPFQVAGVVAASAIGLAAFFWGNRPSFLLASYWWIGVLALYLTGGTWGPPLGPTHDMNALGYRLGFQFIFAGDLLIVGLVAGASRLPWRGVSAEGSAGWLAPSAAAARILNGAARGAVAALCLVFATGCAVVAVRGAARARVASVRYPQPGETLRALAGPGGGLPAVAADAHDLGKRIEALTGEPVAATAMSSGFVWNLPGQRRSVLYLYQQDLVRPIHMHPHWFLGEISQHVPEAEWMERQGVWVLRSFRDAAPPTNLPYYIEVAAIQAFVPLAADGRSYDVTRARVFPISKYATQLAACGQLAFRGSEPEWVVNSGADKYPRRFALRARTGPAGPPEMDLDLRAAKGRVSLRFGWRLESTGPRPRGIGMSAMKALAAGHTLWRAELGGPGGKLAWAEIPLENAGSSVVLRCEALTPADTLWIYEFNLTASDFSR